MSAARIGRYQSFIKKLAKDINPEIGITKEALETLNSMVVSLADRLIFQMMILLDQKTKTIKHDLVFYAAQDLPGELQKHTKDFITSALFAKKKLIFPTKRTENLLREKTCKRISKASVVAFTAALEHVTRELIHAAVLQRKDRIRIRPREIQQAVKRDAELFKVFGKGIVMGV